jgi:hypothetical protein
MDPLSKPLVQITTTIKKSVQDYSIMVFVKGLDRKTYTMYTEEQELVGDFMKRHLDQAKIPLSALTDLRLLVNGKRLFQEQRMGTYGIKREDTVSFIKAEMGGAPKPYSERPKEPTIGLF